VQGVVEFQWCVTQYEPQVELLSDRHARTEAVLTLHNPTTTTRAASGAELSTASIMPGTPTHSKITACLGLPTPSVSATHHDRRAGAHEVGVSGGRRDLGQFVGMVLGVQVRSADPTSPHLEQQLSGRWLWSG
jgi:hypothetical protein